LKNNQGDAAATQQAIYSAVLTLAAAAALVSFVPTEANCGAPVVGHIVDRFIKPLCDIAIAAPVKYYLDALFHFRHIRGNMVVQGISEGVFSDAQIQEWLAFSGLSINDMNMLLTLAAAKRFDRLTKDDYALLELYERDLRTTQIDIMKVDNDQMVADAKAELKEAKAALKAGEPTYTYTVRP
jgi:hypothetical protein